MQQLVRRPLVAGLVTAALAAGALGAAVPAPAAVAADTGTAPTVRPGSLDVVGWDDQLVGEKSPRLSWVVDDPDRGESQSAYEVDVRDTGGETVWDSGKIADEHSTQRPYAGPALTSGTSYTWRVRTWDAGDHASEWSDPADLHTGLFELDDWTADWISVHSGDRARSDFTVDDDVAHAVLYSAAWGNVRLRVNGEPVSDEALGTTWTDWDRRVLYRGADVTDLLRDGDNAIGLTVGATLSAPSPDIKVLAQLEVTDTDGERHVVVATDDGWRTAGSPTTRIDTYRGESFDARLETPGWDGPGFADDSWTPATVVSPAVGAPLLSSGATVTATDAVQCCGWSTGAVNDGILVSTDSSQGYHSTTTTTPDETKWLQLDLGSSRPVGSVTLYGASPTNDPAGSNPGAGFPVRYRIEASDDPSFETSTTVVDRTDADQPNPGVTPVAVPASVTGRYVRVTATKLAASSGSYSFRLAELQVRGTDAERDFALSPLEPDPTPLTRAVASIAPVHESTVAPGVRQFDFGQNYAGWVQLSATAPAGTTATLYLGEIRDGNGRVSTSNINFAPGEEQRQTYRYTFAGTGTETWEPMFVYSGFRYAELSGVPDDVQVTVRARPVYTDLQRQSTLDLGDPMLTSIDTAVRQGQLDAMHGLPEDTPTREKKGWAGDALSGVSSILSGFDSDDLYRKYLRDLQTSIFPDGGVASVAPSRQFGREFKVDPAWGAAYPGIAWELYLQQGDEQVLAQHYDDLLGWLDYLAGIADTDHVVVNPEVSYGEDWQATESTPHQFFHTVYYYKDVTTTAEIARVLGHPAKAEELDALAAQIKAGINDRFLNTDTATYANGTQFANAFPLLVGVVPADLEDRVLAKLVAGIRAKDNHLTAGFVGTQPIIQALHKYGRDDVILDTALRNDYPSLGYMIANGPGTIWEKWVNSSASDGTSSKSHPALGGGMEEWFYRGLVGITPVEPGFTRIRLAVPDLPTLPHAGGSQETPLGTVSSSWSRHGADLSYDVEVPVGATADVVLPAANTWSVTEGGKLLDDVDGVTDVAEADGTITVTVGAGSYSFAVTAANGALGRILDRVQTIRDHAASLATAGDLPDAFAESFDDALAATGADVEAAVLAVIDGDDATSTAKVRSALVRVQHLRDALAGASVEAPTRDDLDGRLAALEADLVRATAAALGLSVSLPPVAAPVLPGASVSGTLEVANEGAAAVTGLSATVTVDGWTPGTASSAAVPAGGSVQLPVTVSVPRDADPASYDADLSLTFTVGGSTYTLDDSTSGWATVTSGLTIGDVALTAGGGDPIEHATLSVPITNTGTSPVRGHATATLPAGWKSVPSDPVSVAPGATVVATVPVVVPLDRVGGATAVTVAVQRTSATLVSKDTTVSLDVAAPAAGAVLDHVDWGNAASESNHALQASGNSGTNSEAGRDRRYTSTNTGAFFSALVAVPAGQPFVLRSVETFDDARTKKYDVYVDGTLVKHQLVPRSETGPGLKTYDLLVDDPAVLGNGGDVRVRFEFPAGASGYFDASLADTWVLPVPADSQAPDVSAMATSGTVGDAGWFRSDATVAVSAVDNRDGAPVVETGDGSSWQAYVGPVTVAGEGKHEVSYRATDEAGNASAARTLPVWIDRTAPQTTLAATRGAGVEGADSATLTFTAADALSGVAQTVYRIDGGAWATVGAGKVTVHGFGEHTVEFASTDVAGNPEMVQHQTVDLADVDTVQALVAPQVTGAARYGSTLRATAGSWNTKGLSFGYQWLRDGNPVAGAKAATLRLGAADVGHQLSVRVTATKAGKAPATAVSRPTARVAKATSATRLGVSRTKVKKGKPVRVSVTVVSSPTATGKVTVRVDGKAVKTVTLKRGKASVNVVVKRKGKHKVTAVYAGSSVVAGSSSAPRVIKVG